MTNFYILVANFYIFMANFYILVANFYSFTAKFSSKIAKRIVLPKNTAISSLFHATLPETEAQQIWS